MAYDSAVPNTFVYTYYAVGNTAQDDGGVNGAYAAVGMQGCEFSSSLMKPVRFKDNLMLTLSRTNSGRQRCKQRHDLLHPQRANHARHASQLQCGIERVHESHGSDYFDYYSFGRIVRLRRRRMDRSICSVVRVLRLGIGGVHIV
jgi:hypothetical protein